MLEINKWFFVHLVNFLLLLVLLNIILFKPLLRIFKERQGSTRGALESAKAMDREKSEIVAQINTKLSDARSHAKTIFEELAREGLNIQKNTLETALNESVEMNRKAKEELEVATEKARAALRSDIEAISKKVVEKMVGA